MVAAFQFGEFEVPEAVFSLWSIRLNCILIQGQTHSQMFIFQKYKKIKSNQTFLSSFFFIYIFHKLPNT